MGALGLVVMPVGPVIKVIDS